MYGWCGRQNNDPPENVHALISRTCDYVPLHGKRDFADVIKVMDLKTGRLS